jgi:hypothetical protein
MNDKLMEYLNTRGVEITKRRKPIEITEDEGMLHDVAGVWKEGKDEIRLVVQARCDQIREKLIFSCQPYEVAILRQALVELAGILHDFEKINAEFGKREKDKDGKPKEGT